MDYISEIKKHDKIRFFSLVVTSAILGIVCFMFMVVGYSLVTQNMNTSEDVFFWGYKPVVIISESMEPEMKVNGISIIEKVNNIDEVIIGDIIMFNTKTDGLVLHRVVGNDDLGLITKGDNNDFQDNWRVTNLDIKGKVVNTYNGVADMMTFLFGDLTNIEASRLAFGFGIIVIFIVLLVWVVNFVYDYIKVRTFVTKKGVDVITDSLGYQTLRIQKDDITKLLSVSQADLNFIHKLVVMYYIMKLYNSFREEEKIVRKSNRLYNIANKYVINSLDKEVKRKECELDKLAKAREKAEQDYDLITSINEVYKLEQTLKLPNNSTIEDDSSFENKVEVLDYDINQDNK